MNFPGGSEGKLQCRRPRFNLWVGKNPWKREWQPSPVFLPGEAHGQRSLAGYSPWGCKGLDMTEQLVGLLELKIHIYRPVLLNYYLNAKKEKEMTTILVAVYSVGFTVCLATFI